MADTIEERLVADAGAFREALKIAEKALHDYRCGKVGVKAGDVVKGTHGKKQGVEFLVTRVEPYITAAWVDGRMKKKNGEWSERVYPLYSHWEKT